MYQSHSGYFTRAFGDLDSIAAAVTEHVPVEYDTMIGTGLSGTLVVPTLARILRKHWAIVRKEASPHTSKMVEGEIGDRWLFVDDFVSSGATLRRVQAAVADLRQWDVYGAQRPLSTVFVGTFQYEEYAEGIARAPFLPPQSS
jgi:adenine/guanine phosphoribosyltransferase-like PRPP-binding protein